MRHGTGPSRVAIVTSVLLGLSAAYNPSDYPRDYSFPSVDATLRWKVLAAASSTFEVALEVDVPSTWSDYWVGFGITKAGGMMGADIVHYQSSTGAVTDAHAKAYARPTVDDCQDWTFVSASTTTSSISGRVKVVVEMSRSVDTADGQDHALVVDDDGTTQEVRLIAAFGQGTFGQHTSSNRGTGATTLYGATNPASDLLAPLRADTANYDTVSVLAQSHTFTPVQINNEQQTWEYYEFSTKLSNVSLYGDQDERFIVGIEAVVDQVDNVHHFVVALESLDGNGDCDSGSRTYIWAWAPGVRPLRFPANMGMRVNANASKCLWVQIHYDNVPTGATVIDSSGVRIVATKPGGQAGMIEAGMLQIGDPNVGLGLSGAITPPYNPFGEGVGGPTASSSKVGAGQTKWTFDCPQECLQTPHFTDSSVTILEIGHHMHAIGKHSIVEIVRAGQTVFSDTFDYYDFTQSGIGTNQETTRGDIKLQQGDSMKIECFFNDPSPQNPTLFGQGSRDEMCMAFVMYYPKQPIPESKCGIQAYCGRTQGNTGLYSASKISSIPHSFGAAGTCPGTGAGHRLQSFLVLLVAAAAAVLSAY